MTLPPRGTTFNEFITQIVSHPLSFDDPLVSNEDLRARVCASRVFDEQVM